MNVCVIFKKAEEDMAANGDCKRISRCCSQQCHQGQENALPPISELPDHILRLCLEGLDASDLAVAACVCKQWQQITNEEHLWKKRCIAVFGAGLEQFHEMELYSWKKLYEINYLRVKFGRYVMNLNSYIRNFDSHFAQYMPKLLFIPGRREY